MSFCPSVSHSLTYTENRRQWPRWEVAGASGGQTKPLGHLNRVGRCARKQPHTHTDTHTNAYSFIMHVHAQKYKQCPCGYSIGFHLCSKPIALNVRPHHKLLRGYTDTELLHVLPVSVYCSVDLRTSCQNLSMFQMLPFTGSALKLGSKFQFVARFGYFCNGWNSLMRNGTLYVSVRI